MKLRPTGTNVTMPMTGVPYRTPLTDQGHMLGKDMLGDPDPTFLCGRSVHMPQPWYNQSEMRAKYGEAYLIVDTRATGVCGQCHTKWNSEEAKRDYDAELQRQAEPDYVITQEEWEEKMGPTWDVNDQQLALQAEWVAQLFGGQVE